MTPAILLLSRAFTTICEHTDSPYAVGMLVSEEVYAQFLHWLENELKRPPVVDTSGDLPTVNGIPFHVQEGLACQVVFFTDAQVWAKVLQHTDQ